MHPRRARTPHGECASAAPGGGGRYCIQHVGHNNCQSIETSSKMVKSSCVRPETWASVGSVTRTGTAPGLCGRWSSFRQRRWMSMKAASLLPALRRRAPAPGQSLRQPTYGAPYRAFFSIRKSSRTRASISLFEKVWKALAGVLTTYSRRKGLKTRATSACPSRFQ